MLIFMKGELDSANCALASQLAEWRHRQEAGQVDADHGGDDQNKYVSLIIINLPYVAQ